MNSKFAPLRLLLVFVLGCLAPATDEVDQAATTAFANDQTAFDFFVAKGLTTFQAAGIVGNLDQESGVNPAAVQPSGPGRGIAQWSVGARWDTSPNDNATSYATSQGELRSSLNLQLEFIWYELATFPTYGLAQLRATTNVTDATVVFMTKFEVCGTCVQTQRVAFAKAVLAAYGQIPNGASFVSQSWPLASAPAMTLTCGDRVVATLVLKNTGTKAWDGATMLATTVPRDRSSMFAGADWIAPNRAAQITGTVAPGANGSFDFAFDAPTGTACVPGTYVEHFGVVQGTAWFSDPGAAGPADDQITAQIDLVSDRSGSAASGSTAGGCSAGRTGPDSGLLWIAIAAMLCLRRRAATRSRESAATR